MHTTLLSLSLTTLLLPLCTLSCQVASGIKLTNYGYPDASGKPAYKCRGSTVVTTQAGDKTLLGGGSFEKPYAAAVAANSVFKKCELVYVPLLEKYFRVQDDCSGCVSRQLDLYLIQSNKNIGQTSCEQQFGTLNYGRPLHSLIRQPGSGFQLLKAPLFENGKCYDNPADNRVFPKRDGGTVHCPTSKDIAAHELETADPVDTGVDSVDDSGSQNDEDAAARHRGMQNQESPAPSVAARAFVA